MFSINLKPNETLLKWFIGLCGWLLSLSFYSSIYAQSPTHAYINSMRSSSVTHYFVSVGVQAEYGRAETSEVVDLDAADDEFASDAESTKLRNFSLNGYGVRNAIGLEYLKFLQFHIAHTSLNMRNRSESSENYSGSRFDAGAALNFYAPLGNLKLGGGVIGGRYDYHQEEATSTYYGSGYFYNLGYNYFMSNQVSFFVDMRQVSEILKRNTGSDTSEKITIQTNSGGVGFKIWL